MELFEHDRRFRRPPRRLPGPDRPVIVVIVQCRSGFTLLIRSLMTAWPELLRVRQECRRNSFAMTMCMFPPNDRVTRVVRLCYVS